MLLLLRRKAYLQAKMHKTPCSDHFLESVGCGKIACRCGAKHICKSKCTMFGPFLEARGKIASRSGAKRICKSKCTKHTMFGLLGSWEMEKLHAAVAQSAFAQSTLWLEAHLQVKMYKVRMWKNGTSLWRRVHFKVKMLKKRSRTTFGNSDAEKSRAAAARSTFPSQYVKNMKVSGNFRRDRCRNR